MGYEPIEQAAEAICARLGVEARAIIRELRGSSRFQAIVAVVGIYLPDDAPIMHVAVAQEVLKRVKRGEAWTS